MLANDGDLVQCLKRPGLCEFFNAKNFLPLLSNCEIWGGDGEALTVSWNVGSMLYCTWRCMTRYHMQRPDRFNAFNICMLLVRRSVSSSLSLLHSLLPWKFAVQLSKYWRWIKAPPSLHLTCCGMICPAPSCRKFPPVTLACIPLFLCRQKVNDAIPPSNAYQQQPADRQAYVSRDSFVIFWSKCGTAARPSSIQPTTHRPARLTESIPIGDQALRSRDNL